MNLLALPAFTDNYIWMLHDGRQALVVDPGESAPVEHALDVHGLTLAGILVTHHHNDHVGGLSALRHRLKGPVFGPAHEDIPKPFTPLDGGDGIELLGGHFEVIDVPGHTAGHIAYFHRPANDTPLLFCGDTLFSGGCGRLFEGTPVQMHASLSRLAALPGDTRVCCGHEYTLSNLKFARAVEPANTDLQAYTARCEALRAQHQPTLPSSIAQERLINPFLRCDQPEVVQAALTRGAVSRREPDVLAALRQWKNNF
ncbi:MAG TPA: hydroxyacylglutathione hydrolase [Rhizobacter sp.]|nr:hydroxyacylglutathione hydrolase [Rhizobacter sp.]